MSIHDPLNPESEIEALEHLANVGELAGVLAHEFNDFLNVLLLQIAVLECRLPEAEKQDLAEVRKHGQRASELVSRFQQYRHAAGHNASLVDLGEVARQVVEQVEQSSLADNVRLRLQCAESPPVLGTLAEVRRLVRFLVSNAARASAHQGREVRIQLEAVNGKACLKIEDSGTTLSETELKQFFSPTSTRQGVEPLELAACRSLARRLRAGLTAEPRAEGGTRVVVEFGQD